MSIEFIFNKINNLSPNYISIWALPLTNPNADSELIIIPGFSEVSYEQNYRTLFVSYIEKLQTDKFKKIHLVKFNNNHIYNLHQELLTFSEKYNFNVLTDLENQLYKKCGDILYEKLDKNSVYSVLAKSAGAGPAIFLCNTHPEIFKQLNLFAPDVKFISLSIKNVCDTFPKTIVGWNIKDNIVKFVDVWFTLYNILPQNTKLYTYNYHNYPIQFDTRHEINAEFFDNII